MKNKQDGQPTQTKVPIETESMYKGFAYWCPECNIQLFINYNVCPVCARKINWSKENEE